MMSTDVSLPPPYKPKLLDQNYTDFCLTKGITYSNHIQSTSADSKIAKINKINSYIIGKIRKIISKRATWGGKVNPDWNSEYDSLILSSPQDLEEQIPTQID